MAEGCPRTETPSASGVYLLHFDVRNSRRILRQEIYDDYDMKVDIPKDIQMPRVETEYTFQYDVALKDLPLEKSIYGLVSNVMVWFNGEVGSDLTVKGLYRENGNSRQVREIEEYLVSNKGDFSAISPVKDSWTSFSLCSAYKSFIARIKPPILAPIQSFIDQLSDLELDPNDERKIIFDLVLMLPDLHIYALKLLMKHLKLVTAHEESTRMNSSNLGVSFGPILFESKGTNPKNVLQYNHVAATLVEFADLIGCVDGKLALKVNRILEANSRKRHRRRSQSPAERAIEDVWTAMVPSTPMRHTRAPSILIKRRRDCTSVAASDQVGGLEVVTPSTPPPIVHDAVCADVRDRTSTGGELCPTPEGAVTNSLASSNTDTQERGRDRSKKGFFWKLLSRN